MMVFSQAAFYLFTLLERSNFDLIYLAWLWTLFKPLCLLLLSLFLLPATILLFIYGSSMFCLIYKHWNRLKVGEFFCR
jgi:TRAP-type mannitol/chloroaromatic compound transport system permease small subunit